MFIVHRTGFYKLKVEDISRPPMSHTISVWYIMPEDSGRNLPQTPLFLLTRNLLWSITDLY
jgi:hypothetical protein